MPAIWVSDKDYEILVKIKAGLEQSRKRSVGFPDVISYLIEVTSIPAIPPDEDLIPKLERLRSVVKKRMGKEGRGVNSWATTQCWRPAYDGNPGAMVDSFPESDLSNIHD